MNARNKCYARRERLKACHGTESSVTTYSTRGNEYDVASALNNSVWRVVEPNKSGIATRKANLRISTNVKVSTYKQCARKTKSVNFKHTS